MQDLFREVLTEQNPATASTGRYSINSLQVSTASSIKPRQKLKTARQSAAEYLTIEKICKIKLK